jgi:predicted small metal-binding protein
MVLYCGSSKKERKRRRPHMAKIVSCRDVGVDCDFVAKGETEQDILRQCTEHARTAHNMTEIPAELVDKVRGAIRDEAA